MAAGAHLRREVFSRGPAAGADAGAAEGGPLLRNGRYSPALLTSDVDAIQNLYRANGFSDVNVTTDCERRTGGCQRACVEDRQHPRDHHDRGGRAAEVRHGSAERRGPGAHEGCEVTDEHDRRSAVFAGHARRRSRHHTELLPEPRLRPGEHHRGAEQGRRRSARRPMSRWTWSKGIRSLSIACCSPASTTRGRRTCRASCACMRAIRWTRRRCWTRSGTSTISRSSTR